MANKKQKQNKRKVVKQFDYNYCMKRPNCKFCKYERSCEQFATRYEKLDKIIKDNK